MNVTEVDKVRSQLKKALEKRDLLLIQADRSVDELSKIANVMNERLREWYIVYFPEAIIKDNVKFAKFASLFDKTRPDEKALAEHFGEKKAGEFVSLAMRSMGSQLTPSDADALRAYARKLDELYQLRTQLSSYVDSAANEIAPNISYLAGPQLAAKLITFAGSLEKLATFPASTVQVLGAEKALFKHLRKNCKPPKHGIIFLHQAITNAPKHLRGKISRALAAKLAIASKADFYSKNFIAEKLKKDFEERLRAINRSK